jgi:excisionase family DNA binding protein
MTTGDKAVFDMADVAELFKCSREKVKRMARSGELPAFKFGKRWYIRQDDLEHFLAGRVELKGHLRRIQEV